MATTVGPCARLPKVIYKVMACEAAMLRANHIALARSRASTCMPQEPATKRSSYRPATSTRIRYTPYTNIIYPAYTQYCILGTDTRTPTSGHWRPRHALEKHRTNPSRVILLRFSISPRLPRQRSL